MTTSGRVTSCCVVLLLTLTSVSSVQRLNSINELSQNDQDFHEQILALLEWFATTADINDNGMWFTFDPVGGDYGSHHYGNFEGLLEKPSNGHQYYTLGNIYHQESSVELPQNVVRSIRIDENRVRIIMSITRPNQGSQRRRIDRVYITRHYDRTRYDPEHTYEISTQLLREMRDNLRAQPSFREQSARHTSHSQSYNYRDHHQEDQWSAVGVCLKICLFVLLLFIIGIILANSQQPKSRWP